VSLDSAGNQGNGDSFHPSISADGRTVAFITEASNLVPGDTNGLDDIVLHQLRTTPLDFDRDVKTDIAVWRPSGGIWYIIDSSGGTTTTQWGNSSDNTVPGDYDGDGKTDFAVWRPPTGSWYVMQSSNNTMMSQEWGAPTDIPVPGDYDGDGNTDIAVFRQSTGFWYIVRSSDGAVVSSQWGAVGDIPVPGDYDGDGKTDIAVWKPSGGLWFIQRSTVGVFDYNVYPGSTAPTQWGLSTDITVPGDYDGDGKTDIAVWRPSSGFWYIVRTSDGGITSQQWGLGSDTPQKSGY
jgi:hypothetical protein